MGRWLGAISRIYPTTRHDGRHFQLGIYTCTYTSAAQGLGRTRGGHLAIPFPSLLTSHDEHVHLPVLFSHDGEQPNCMQMGTTVIYGGWVRAFILCHSTSLLYSLCEHCCVACEFVNRPIIRKLIVIN